MSDQIPFETRLADAFDRYLVGAPVHVDAPRLTAAVAVRRSWALPRIGGFRVALVLGLLALASAAALLLAGSLMTREDRPPIAASGRIIAWFATGDGRVITPGDPGARVRNVETRSSCPRVIGNADGTATNVRFTGIVFNGFDGGTSTVSTKYSGGERWSSDSSTLALLNFDEPSVTLVTAPEGDVSRLSRSRIGLGTFWPTGTNFEGSFSSDGTGYVVVANDLPGAIASVPRILVLDFTNGAVRPIAVQPALAVPLRYEPVLSPDGNTLLLVTTDARGTTATAITMATGAFRSLGSPVDPPPDAPWSAVWSLDGTRVAVRMGSGIEVLDVERGEWTPTLLIGSEQAVIAWSPDGSMLGVLDGRSLSVLDTTTGKVRDRTLPSTAAAWSPDRTAVAVMDLDAAASPGNATIGAIDPWSDRAPVVLDILPVPDGPAVPRLGDARDAPCLQWLPVPNP